MFPPWIAATYMSHDEAERAEAFNYGYAAVCQHPDEIAILEPDQVLVMDLNRVLFDDWALALAVATAAAHRGVTVGIHTYDPESPKFQGLAKLPNVLVATTHRRLLHKLGRHARLHGRPWTKIARAAKPLKGKVNHDADYPTEGTLGPDASVPAGS